MKKPPRSSIIWSVAVLIVLSASIGLSIKAKHIFASTGIQAVEVENSASCGTTNCTVNFTTPTTQGELVVVTYVMGPGGGTIGGGVTDNLSDTYTKVYETTGLATHDVMGMYYLANAPAGITSLTVPMGSGNNASYSAVIAGHYTGVATSNVLDSFSAPNSTGSSTPWASGAIATSQAGDLLVGGLYARNNGSAQCAVTLAGNWTEDKDSPSFDGANGGDMVYGHEIVASIQSGIQFTGTTATCTPTANYSGIAAFAPGTGGGGSGGSGGGFSTSTDTTPPTVSITSPSSGATVSGTISISGVASDNVGVSSVQISIDGGSYQSISGTTSWTYSLNTASLSNGSHTIEAEATDAAGNVGTSGTITVTVNNSSGSGGGGTGLTATGYHGCQPGGTCYYISYSTGSDSNDGLSETNTGNGHGPWKYPPFDEQQATGKSAAHVPQSTDEYIFRGEVWPTPAGTVSPSNYEGYPGGFWYLATGNASAPSGNHYPGLYIGYDPTWNDGTVKSIRLTSPGYDCTSAPTVVISDASGDTTGSGAAATAALSTATWGQGDVVGVTLTNPGANYTQNPNVSFVGGGCVDPPTAVANIQSPVLDGSGSTFGTTSAVYPMFEILHSDYMTLDGFEFRNYHWPQGYNSGGGGPGMVSVHYSTYGHFTVENNYFHGFGVTSTVACDSACQSSGSNFGDYAGTAMLSMGYETGDTNTGNWFSNYEATTWGPLGNGCDPTYHTSSDLCSQGVGSDGSGAIISNNYYSSLRGGFYFNGVPAVGMQISGNHMFDFDYDSDNQHGDVTYGAANGAFYNNKIWDNEGGSATIYEETSQKTAPTDAGFTMYFFNNVCYNTSAGGSQCPSMTTELYPTTVASVSPLPHFYILNNTVSLAGSVNNGAGGCFGAGQWFGDSPSLVQGVSPANGTYPWSFDVHNNFCMLNSSNGYLAIDQAAAVNNGLVCPSGGCGTWNGILGGASSAAVASANQVTTIPTASGEGYNAANAYQPNSGTNDSVTFANSGNSTNYTSLCSQSVDGVSLSALCYDINGNPRPATGGWQAGAYQYSGSSGSGSDTTPPSVSLTSPANNASLSGTVSVSASASDNVGVTKVEFYLDGTLASTDTSSPYAWSWNTTNSSNGTHTLLAKAYDAAGNIGSAGSVTVTVANTASSIPTSTPLTIASVVTSLTDTTAAITITLSSPGSVVLRYGPTTSYGSATPSSPDLTTIYENLTGLTESTSYDYLVSVTPEGSTSTVTSANLTFTTNATPVTNPPSGGGGGGGGGGSAPVTTPPPSSGGGGGGGSILPTPPAGTSTASSSPTSTPSSTLYFPRVLTIGMTGLDVMTLQKLLLALGFFPTTITPTSYYGSITEHALLLFQGAHHLPTSGSLDAATLPLMNKVANATWGGGAATPAPPTPTSASFPTNLAPGSSGPEVTLLQKTLFTNGDYPADLVTGYYGALTEQAVKVFQAKYGIVDYGSPATTGYGAVGPKTRAKLGEV